MFHDREYGDVVVFNVHAPSETETHLQLYCPERYFAALSDYAKRYRCNYAVVIHGYRHGRAWLDATRKHFRGKWKQFPGQPALTLVKFH